MGRIRTLLGVLCISASVAAQSTTWTGAVSNSWDAPGNWDAGVPTSTTDAVVPAAANVPEVFLTDPSCRDLSIGSGATVTLTAGFDLTITGDLSIASTGGLVVSSSSSNVVVTGDWTNDGTFTAGGGTVEFVGSGVVVGGAPTSFHDLVIDSGTRTAFVAIDVSGDGSVKAGATFGLGSFTHTIAGNWTSSAAGAVTTGTGWLELGGSGVLTTLANPVPNVRVTGGTRTINSSIIAGDLEMTGGTLQVNDGATVVVDGAAALTGGTLSWTSTFAGDETLAVSGDVTLTASAGTTSPDAVLVCGGDWSSDATFAPASGTVEIAGTTSIGGAAPTFASLRVTSGTATLGAATTLAGDLTVDGGASLALDAFALDAAGDVAVVGALDVGPNTVTVGGDWACNAAGASVTGTGLVEFTGTGSLVTGANSVPNVLVSAGTRSVSNTTVTGDLTMTGGTVAVLDNATLSVAGDASLTGGQLTFVGLTAGAEVLDVDGDATVTAAAGGTSSATTIRCAGNWSSDATFAPANGVLELDGGTAATLGGTGTTLASLRIVDGTKTVTDALVLGQDLIVASGATLDTDAALAVGADVSLGDDTASWDAGALTHTVAGNLSSAGADVVGSGTLEFTGDGLLLATGSNVELPGVLVSGGARDVFGVSVTGDLSMSDGSLVLLDNTTIPVAGDLLITGGTLGFDDTSAGDQVLDVAGSVDVDAAPGVIDAASRIECAGDWTSTAVFAFDAGTVVLDSPASVATIDAVTLPAVDVQTATNTFVAPTNVTGTLSIADGATVASSAALDVDGDVVLGDATATWDLGAFTHTVAGSYTSGGGEATGTGGIDFDGAGTLDASGPLPNVTISAGTRTALAGSVTGDLTLVGGTLLVGNDALVSVGGNADLTGGTFGWTASPTGDVDVLDVEGDATVTAAAGNTTSNSLIRVAGDWSSSSAFSPSSGVVELDGAGTTSIGGASPTFAFLRLAGGIKTVDSPTTVSVLLDVLDGVSLVTAAAVDVDGSVTLGDGTASWDMGGLTHTVGGNYTASGADATNGTIDFEATGVTKTGGGALGAVVVSGGVRGLESVDVLGDLVQTGGTVRIRDDAVVAVAGVASFDGDVLEFEPVAAGANDVLDVEGDVTITAASGTMSAQSRLRCAGSYSADALFVPGAGRVELDGGTAATVSGTGTTFHQLTVVDGTKTVTAPVLVQDNLSVESGATLDADAVLTVAGNVSLGDASTTLDIGSLTHTISGSYSGGGGSTTGDGTLAFDGTGIIVTGSGTMGNVRIDAGSHGTLDVNVVGDLEMTGGALQLQDDSTLTVSGNADLMGGSLGFAGGQPGLEVLDVEGNVTILASAAATSGDSRIFCGGDWTSDAAFAPGSGLTVFDGGATTIGGTDPQLADAQVASGVKTLVSPLTLTGDLTLDTGAGLVTDAILTVGGDVTLGDATSSWDLGTLTHAVGGGWVGSGGSATNGTVELTGDGALATGTGAIANVTISGGAHAVSDTNVTGDLSLSAGSIEVGDDQTLAVGGNADLLGDTVSWTADAQGGPDVIDVEGDVTLAAAAGTTTANSTLRVAGNLVADATFAMTAGLVELDGGAATVSGTGPTLPDLGIVSGTKTVTVDTSLAGDLDVASGATLDADAVLDVGGGVTLGDDTASWDTGGLTHTVAGDWSTAGASTTGGGTIAFDGPGTLDTGTASIENVLVSAGARAVATATVVGDLSMTGGGLELLDNATLAVGNDALLTGGTLSFTGETAGDELVDVEGSVTLTAAAGATSDTARVECAGNWSSSGAWAPGAGTVVLDGAATTLIDGAAPDFTATFSELVLSNGVRQAGADFDLAVDTLLVEPGAELLVGDRRVAVPGSSLRVEGALTVGAGGELALGPTAVLTVPAGGLLRVVGDPDDDARVTGEDGGGYFLTIAGTLEAGLFEFSGMGPSGVVVADGATFGDFPNDLRGGTFTGPAPIPGSSLLSLTRSTPIEFRYVDFEDPAAVGANNVETLVRGAVATFVNSEGSIAGEAFDFDPLEQVAWLTDATTLDGFAAAAGLMEVDVSWTSTLEVDLVQYVVQRATDPAGPFTTVFTTPAVGPSSYGFLDTDLVANQTYVYRLFGELTHGELDLLAEDTATPFGGDLPPNVLDVDPVDGTYADIQAAIDDVGANVNAIVLVAPGTYPAFTVQPGFLGTLRVLGDGTGPVIVETTDQAVQVLDLAPTDSVEMSDLEIGSTDSPNAGMLVQDAQGIVIMDESSVQGGSGAEGVRLANATRVVIQKSDLAGSLGAPGLVLELGSLAVAAQGSLDAVDLSGNSSLRLAELSPSETVEPGSSVTTLPGVHADVDAPEFVSINEEFTITLSGEPLGTWMLIVALDFVWNDLPGPKWEGVGLANLGPIGILASGPILPEGSTPLPTVLPDDGSLFGVPLVFQTVVIHPDTGQRRWSNVASITALPQ